VLLSFMCEVLWIRESELSIRDVVSVVGSHGLLDAGRVEKGVYEGEGALVFENGPVLSLGMHLNTQSTRCRRPSRIHTCLMSAVLFLIVTCCFAHVDTAFMGDECCTRPSQATCAAWKLLHVLETFSLCRMFIGDTGSHPPFLLLPGDP
jgi:hypothetical protein